MYSQSCPRYIWEPSSRPHSLIYSPFHSVSHSHSRFHQPQPPVHSYRQWCVEWNGEWDLWRGPGVAWRSPGEEWWWPGGHFLPPPPPRLLRPFLPLEIHYPKPSESQRVQGRQVRYERYKVVSLYLHWRRRLSSCFVRFFIRCSGLEVGCPFPHFL